MIPFSAIRTHLVQAGITGIQRVHGAVQLAVAIERGQFDADAYVSLQSRAAEPNNLVNAVQQKVTARLAVISVIRSAGDPTGERQAEDIETRSNEIIGALLNWSPDLALSPFVYAGGRLLDFDGSAVVWADEFETDYFIRKTS
ncbi:MAG: hypothetical protein M0P19_08335 [Nevskia sp.]|jgi:hypothetical protein|nr:hypothetical protein [Nevskia sp.]MCK9385056.1 hypothetical protein [Nevskia sp.]